MIAVTDMAQEDFGTARIHVVKTLDEALELSRRLNGGRDLRATLLPPRCQHPPQIPVMTPCLQTGKPRPLPGLRLFGSAAAPQLSRAFISSISRSCRAQLMP